MMNDITII